MKSRRYATLILVFAWLAADSFGALAQQAPSPAAGFPEIRYEFQSVPDGTEITHDFLVRNAGGAVLNIHKVKSG